MEDKISSDLSIHISEGCLVVPIQGEIDEKRMEAIQAQILEAIKKTSLKGVVIDLSGVRILEPYFAEVIDRTAKMIRLLGAKTILSGINPGVAISLTDYHFLFKEIFGTARTFEDGVEKLHTVIAVDEEIEFDEVEKDADKGEIEAEGNSIDEKERDEGDFSEGEREFS